MNELEMCRTLGILFDPNKNKLSVSSEIKEDIEILCQALIESTSQKERFGTVNQDMWLEFIPWHSLN